MKTETWESSADGKFLKPSRLGNECKWSRVQQEKVSGKRIQDISSETEDPGE